MNGWPFSGARWWRFDFHTHTPASCDFMEGCDQHDKDKVTPKLWLQRFMEREIDCVAVTDHNSGQWVDRLKEELGKLEQDRPDWYRPLYLFSGVEISASGGVHILAVLGTDKTTADIHSLLGAVGYRGKRGACNAEATQSVGEIIDTIHKHGGIAIPAHADIDKGLFKLEGIALATVLQKENILAIELVDSDSLRPPQFSKVRWSEVRGSDTHNFRCKNFGKFTWVKMNSQPSIEGLKLALLDGSVDLDMEADPNRYPDLVIEELRVEQAKYLGRAEPLVCRFSPFLNTIIGGRGSGKSTLLEFMRFVLRRDDGIGEHLPDLRKYFSTDDDGLLTTDSVLSLVYRKHEVRYRLNWTAKGDTASFEEYKGDEWQPCQGEIKSLFPADIYSQKQIFALANDPDSGGVLKKIDDTAEVDKNASDNQMKDLAYRYHQLEHKTRELCDKIANGKKISGEHDDLQRQIEQLEKSGHKDILQRYRLRQRQLSEIKRLEDKWQGLDRQLGEVHDNIDWDSLAFAEKIFAEQPDILSALRRENEAWLAVSRELGALRKKATALLCDWPSRKKSAPWMQALQGDTQAYAELREQLASEGIDPNRYPSLLQKRDVLQQELNNIAGCESELARLAQEKETILAHRRQAREALTENRQKFLNGVLPDDKSFHIEVVPFGERWNGVENSIRRMFRCGDRFDADVDHLKEIYHQRDGGKNFAGLKKTVLDIHSKKTDAKDKRFAIHLQGLPQESINDLMLWLPEDSLKITFGREKQNLQQGSPGQKAVALLAFILSYGDSPLLLDQPEDDLDNAVIYRAIVRQLRQKKTRRQLIIVTHNANIVVNGDAEMVFPLEVSGGESRAEQADGIQNREVRQAICDVLEGGKQAFEERYKRIHLEE